MRQLRSRKESKKPDGRFWIVIATGLRQIPSCDDAKFDAEMLKQDRHEIGDHDDGKQRVTKSGTAGQIGGPVAGVHVAHRDEKPGAGESRQLPPKGRLRRNDDAPVDFRQRNWPALAATPRRAPVSFPAILPNLLTSDRSLELN